MVGCGGIDGEVVYGGVVVWCVEVSCDGGVYYKDVEFGFVWLYVVFVMSSWYCNLVLCDNCLLVCFWCMGFVRVSCFGWLLDFEWKELEEIGFCGVFLVERLVCGVVCVYLKWLLLNLGFVICFFCWWKEFGCWGKLGYMWWWLLVSGFV